MSTSKDTQNEPAAETEDIPVPVASNTEAGDDYEDEDEEEEEAGEEGPGLAALLGDDLADEDEADEDFNAANTTEEADITLIEEEGDVEDEEKDDLKRDLAEDEQVEGPRTKRTRTSAE